jgi:hypothetical protein
VQNSDSDVIAHSPELNVYVSINPIIQSKTRLMSHAATHPTRDYSAPISHLEPDESSPHHHTISVIHFSIIIPSISFGVSFLQAFWSKYWYALLKYHSVYYIFK